MNLFTYAITPTSPPQFIAYWNATYSYAEEHRYTNNINGPHTPDTLRELFKWKIGKRFEGAHMPHVEERFISQLEHARQICQTATAEEFVAAFPSQYTIYRLFWAHCWQPNRFPIYDQHVHRAMTFITSGERDELERYGAAEKIKLYVKEYLPFVQQFAGIDQREVDRALWSFGSFIKTPPIPIE